MTNLPEQLVFPLVEKLITLKEASERLGVPYFKIQRAAHEGLFPSYFIYNTRRLVRMSEVIAAIEASRQGGEL